MATQRIEKSGLKLSSAYLISVDNSGTQVIEVGDFLTIGRDPANAVELADPYVSSRHARIERKSDGLLIRDLRSQNGTFVNGIKILEAYLAPGDRIRFGEREFLFQKEATLPKQKEVPISKNEKWSQQLASLPLFARTDLPVLLLGASGTGKEVIAHAIHELSQRTDGPFVSVNCSALHESLIESELFGHVKGSFTGATHDRKGAFEAARGGTLFLDEIGDLPLSLQPKLLRALENREIRPVGSDRIVSTNVRIVAATHKNLPAQVQKALFRADLFYRLHVIKILIPTLKDRLEDFEALLYGFAREMRVRFSFDAIQGLKLYSWPGNIRELRNVVARASALKPGQEILREHIPLLLDEPAPIATPTLPTYHFQGARPALREIEKDMIVQRLVQNQGNQRKTAIDLGMPKSTLHDRIKTYGIDIDKLLNENLLTV